MINLVIFWRNNCKWRVVMLYCSIKKIWSNRMVKKDGRGCGKQRFAGSAVWRRISTRIAKWDYTLQCPQQGSGWFCVKSRPFVIVLSSLCLFPWLHWFKVFSVVLLGSRSGFWYCHYLWWRCSICIPVLWKCQELSRCDRGNGNSCFWDVRLRTGM